MTGMEFMLAPLAASLLLIIITVYFGIHVIEREIIFIDIALAQIAALGSAVSLVIKNISGHAGHEHDSRTILAYLFCVGAAFFFTILKNKKIRIPLEAVIGIAYAVATTSAVIILDKGAGSDVHIHDMLTGSILWVTWPQILRLAVVVILTGGFHYVFREKFRKVTLSYHGTETGLKNPKLWDFIFYMTFGIVIVEAVNIGGILTIFAFLIIPSSVSSLFAGRWTNRILIGLLVGGISTLLGLYLSWNMDIPCSPAIIMFLGVALLLAVMVRVIRKLLVRQKQSG
ncbi:MAG TPA: metal ABC transporter permease [Bacteroidales bacterium]|nr:metal ABC transporter permease [Bacteroidales bacterium]HPJ58922.1 metal ABC transporter permease [Bacteroidales bacterium]HPR12176.1 metal ABC transporter permease [Bacteroidales bacterium]HRW84859.1 metal ABC transporter permease [Bacteroidales bacterium]